MDPTVLIIYLLMLLSVASLSTQTSPHSIENTLLELNALILGRLEKMDARMLQMEGKMEKVARLDDIDSRLTDMWDKLEKIVGLDAMNARLSEIEGKLGKLAQLDDLNTKLSNMDSRLWQIITLGERSYNSQTSIDNALKVLEERSSQSQISMNDALNGPVNIILEEIQLMKGKRNSFDTAINDITVKSNTLLTKLDIIENQLSQGVESLKGSVDKIKLQGSNTLQEMKLVIDKVTKLDTDKHLQNRDLSTNIDTIKSQLNQSITSLKYPVNEILSKGSELQEEIKLLKKCDNFSNTTILDVIDSKLSNMEGKLEKVDRLDELSTKLSNLYERCPSGFFMSEGSKQCFRFFNDKKRSWDEAKQKCEDEGLLLAKPTDEVADVLRKDIIDMYGNSKGHAYYAWLDARGNGNNFIWQRDGTELRNDSPLWWYLSPDQRTSRFCLRLVTMLPSWRAYTGMPYCSFQCSYGFYTLCEVKRGCSTAGTSC